MNFKELLLSAKNGDAEAMEKLIEMYKPLITRYSFFNDTFDEDLHQEQLLKFVHCVNSFSEKFPAKCNEITHKSVISAASDNYSDEIQLGGRKYGKEEKS